MHVIGFNLIIIIICIFIHVHVDLPEHQSAGAEAFIMGAAPPPFEF
jgi:hypothetical protein